jgi:hypothetical protein
MNSIAHIETPCGVSVYLFDGDSAGIKATISSQSLRAIGKGDDNDNDWLSAINNSAVYAPKRTKPSDGNTW